MMEEKCFQLFSVIFFEKILVWYVAHHVRVFISNSVCTHTTIANLEDCTNKIFQYFED